MKEYSDQIEGRNAVLELLESGKDINKIFVEKGEKHGSINKILAKAKERKVIIVEKDKKQFPPRWENSVSQNRFSQYSSRDRKVGFCGFSSELLPRQTLDPVTLKNGARNSGVVSTGCFPLKANTSIFPFFTR